MNFFFRDRYADGTFMTKEDQRLFLLASFSTILIFAAIVLALAVLILG